MTAPWAAPARSRWFDRPPPADETPREGALRRDLLAAVEWADGLVQVGWLLPETADWGSTALHLHPKVFPRYVGEPRQAQGRVPARLRGAGGPMTFDVDGVRTRLALATPGPWFTNEPGPYVHSVWSKDRPEDVLPVNPIAKMVAPDDARLIAHAPTDLAAALDEIDALRAAIAASAEEAAPGTLTPREQRIYAAGFEFGRKAAAEGARLAAERGATWHFNPISELLKAGQIVGLDPREMTRIALEELAAERGLAGEGA